MSDKSIAEQVAAREAELLGGGSHKSYDAPAALDFEFVRACFEANDRGNGLLLAALMYNKFLYVTTPDKKGEWYYWDGHVWQYDEYDTHYKMCHQAALCFYDYADDIQHQLDKVLADLEEAREQEIAEIKEQFDEEEAAKKIKAIRKKPLNPPSWMFPTIKAYRKRGWDLDGNTKMSTSIRLAPRMDNRIATVSENLDQKKWLLPCPVGVIDLKSGILVDGKPSDLMTKRIDVNFNPHADYTLWQNTIDSICLDPKIPGSEQLPGFLKRLFGYAMTGNVNEEFLAIFLGPGRNGKGTIIETITKVMGPYYHKANRSLFTEQKHEPPPSATSEHMWALMGKRLVIGAETNKGQKIDLGRTKDLTGGNEINYRRNYGSEKTFYATHTMLLETNHLSPGLTKEFSMLQRLVLIEFSYMFVDDIEAEEKKKPAMKGQFKQKDKNLKEKLKTPEQLEGVLRWMVEGCMEWQEHGLQIPDCVLSYRDKLSAKEDSIQNFMDDIMEYHEDKETLRMTFANFYKAFTWWWKENMDDSQSGKVTHKNTVSKWLDERKIYTDKIGGVKWVFKYNVKDDVQEQVSELRDLAKEFF